MTLNIRNILASAAVAVTLPLAAGAVPVSPGSEIGEGFALAPNGSAVFNYEVSGPVRVSIVSISGSGFSGGDDLYKVLFGVGATDTGFTTVNSNGSTGNATGTLPTFVTSNDFSLNFFADGTAKTVIMGYTFTVSAVPVPAAGALLLGAMGGLAALGRRKKKNA
ncbi:hypothetical protein GCM10011360_17270 [Primorskyibacter flagellatus]|uniref:VPLPA-CTERM protein sorting domain-containing protein n=1 Tax=Primorskyibacter flagellatus TaxID=1387277 RepID=A0A917EEF4_9RHOB|nr:VPLPA-CTERM sorting domain-containing protein [Primorskyibacter flagellatus]GGE29744.1 hypothetical protein GCM10011360_17270 [Primorskyibacter flagellatus]